MKIIPSVVCYIEKDGKLLFIKRNHPPDLGKFVPPGGKIEEKEDPMVCVKREIEEETGLILQDFSYLGTTIHYGKNEEWIIFIFYSNKFKGILREGKEGPLFWIDKDKVKTLSLPPGDYYVLPYLFSEIIFFGTFWYNERDKLIDYKIWPAR